MVQPSRAEQKHYTLEHKGPLPVGFHVICLTFCKPNTGSKGFPLCSTMRFEDNFEVNSDHVEPLGSVKNCIFKNPLSSGYSTILQDQ